MRGLLAVAGEDLQKNQAVRSCCTCPPLPEDHGPRSVGLCAWSTAEGNAQVSCADRLSLTLIKSGGGRLRRSSEHRQASAGDSDARVRVEGDVQPRPPVIWRETSLRGYREGDIETVAGVGQAAPWRVSAPPGRDDAHAFLTCKGFQLFPSFGPGQSVFCGKGTGCALPNWIYSLHAWGEAGAPGSPDEGGRLLSHAWKWATTKWVCFSIPLPDHVGLWPFASSLVFPAVHPENLASFLLVRDREAQVVPFNCKVALAGHL